MRVHQLSVLIDNIDYVYVVYIIYGVNPPQSGQASPDFTSVLLFVLWSVLGGSLVSAQECLVASEAASPYVDLPIRKWGGIIWKFPQREAIDHLKLWRPVVYTYMLKTYMCMYIIDNLYYLSKYLYIHV